MIADGVRVLFEGVRRRRAQLHAEGCACDLDQWDHRIRRIGPIDVIEVRFWHDDDCLVDPPPVAEKGRML